MRAVTDGTLTGRCFCGEVCFEVSDTADFVCCCHCESCRRAAGGVYVAWATFSKASFRITRGDVLEHRSAPSVTRGLCARCGTALTYEHENRHGEIDVTLTSFDQPAAFAPKAHIWVEDKLPWVSIEDGLPQYQRTVV